MTLAMNVEKGIACLYLGLHALSGREASQVCRGSAGDGRQACVHGGCALTAGECGVVSMALTAEEWRVACVGLSACSSGTDVGCWDCRCQLASVAGYVSLSDVVFAGD